jgi:hypothetical protein
VVLKNCQKSKNLEAGLSISKMNKKREAKAEVINKNHWTAQH